MGEALSSTQRRRTFIALANPHFRLYMLGQVISVAGNWMQTVAQGWLVYQVTSSELWLGIVSFASGLPMLLISPMAGVMADRYDRRRVMMFGLTSEMLLIFLMALLTFFEIIEAWQIALLAVGIGIALAFSEPARQAFMKELVGNDALHSGIAINAMLRNSASIMGPALAGVLLVSVGAAWCFLLNSFSFLAAIATLHIVQIGFPAEQKIVQPAWQALREGLAYIAYHQTLAPILFLATTLGVFGINAVIVLMPAFAVVALDSPTVAFTMMSMALGIGSLLGSGLSVRFGNRLGRGKLAILLGLGMPIILLIYSQVTTIPAAVVAMGFIGFGFTMFFVNSNVMIQTEVPDEYRGRVVSIWALQRFGLSPIIALFIGILAQFTSVIIALSFLAGLTLCISCGIAYRAKSVRTIQ